GLRRTVLWHPRYWIDLVSVEADAERDVELVFHHRGVRATGPDLVPATDRDDGPYAYLSTVATMSTPTRSWDTSWQVEGVTTRLWAHDPADTLVLTATSPTSPPAEDRQTTVRRAR